MASPKRTVRKLDLRKQYREFYLPSAKEVVLVDVPEFLFLAVDGVVEAGVRRIIYTDIRSDGMLTGPNVAALRELAEAIEALKQGWPPRMQAPLTTRSRR